MDFCYLKMNFFMTDYFVDVTFLSLSLSLTPFQVIILNMTDEDLVRSINIEVLLSAESCCSDGTSHMLRGTEYDLVRMRHGRSFHFEVSLKNPIHTAQGRIQQILKEGEEGGGEKFFGEKSLINQSLKKGYFYNL